MHVHWGEFKPSRVNLGLLVAGLVLVTTWLAGPSGTIAGYNLGKGAPRWAFYAWPTVGGALILAAVLAAWTPMRVLWTGRGFAGAAPRLPARLVKRPETTKKISQALRPSPVPVALIGIGGVGKSTLAAAACHLWRVRRRFRDGMTWLEVGPKQDPLVLLADLARRVGLPESESRFATLPQGRDRIGAVLRHKRFLIALDNVWERSPLDAVMGLAPAGAVMFTSRQADLALTFNAVRITVDELTQDQALALLGSWMNRPTDELPPEARTLCTQVGNLALGVAMAGAMVAQGRPICDVLARIEEDLSRVHAEMDPAYGYRTLRAAIEASISDLSDASQQQYEQLAVFDGRGPFTRDAAAALWQPEMPEGDTADLLAELTGRSLLGDAGNGRYAAHDLQYDVLRQRLGPAGLAAAHGRLLDGFRIRYPDGWASSAGDPYLADTLAGHLDDAGLAGELTELLADVTWIEARLAQGQLPGLVSDYQFAPQPQSRQIGEAIRLSAPVLASDPSQLRGQLRGRLLRSTDHDTAMWGILLRTGWGHGPSLVPITPALTPADPRRRDAYDAIDTMSMAAAPAGTRAVTGSADGRLHVWDMRYASLERIVGNVTGTKVRSVAMFDHVKRALVGGDDGAVRVQDVGNGGQIAVACRHTRPVTSVVITSADTLAISGSMDGTLRLWHLPDLAESLAIQTGPVLCAAARSDGKAAVTGSQDGGFKVWDLTSGARVVTLGGHSGPIQALAFTNDQTRAVTVGDDGTLRMWTLAGGSGPVLNTRSGPLTSVVVTADDRLAITGGRDGAVRVWDLVAQREIAHWQGDSAIVSCVLLGESPIEIAVAEEKGPPYRLEMQN